MQFILFQVVSGECILYAFWPSLLLSSVIGVLVVSVQFFIPFLTLVYCYGRIVWVLTRRISSNIGDNNAADNVQSKFQTARTNTIKTFLLVGICFIICWSNNQIYYLMYLLGFDADWNGIYYRFTILMIFLNCTVNPFIYLLKYKDYQVALREFLKCGTQKSGDYSESNVSLSVSGTGVTGIK